MNFFVQVRANSFSTTATVFKVLKTNIGAKRSIFLYEKEQNKIKTVKY